MGVFSDVWILLKTLGRFVVTDFLDAKGSWRRGRIQRHYEQGFEMCERASIPGRKNSLDYW